MNRFKLIYFVIFVINLYKIYAQISDKRLCVDEECKVPISHAKTLLRYSSPDSRILSFAPNADITIYSKSAGSREDLWGGEINGRRGYVPKHMVRETKILQKPTLLVDTEFANDTETKQVPSQVEPDKVREPYEVVDGTTIYLTPQDIIPSSTESPIQTTALPVETNKISQNKAASEIPPNDDIFKTEPSPSKDQEVAQEEVKSPPQTEELSASQETKNDVNADSDVEEIKDNQELSEETSSFDTEDEEDEDEEVDVDDEDGENNEEESEELEETSEGVSFENDQITPKEETAELKNEDISVQTEEKNTEKEETETETPSTVQNEEVVPVTAADVIEETPEKEPLNEEIKSEEPPLPVVTVTESNEEQPKIETDGPKPNADSAESLSSDIPKVVETAQTNEDVTARNPNIDDLDVAPKRQTTTLSPEIEMPEPFYDNFDDVTPNPVDVAEETAAAKETISTLPPLGLFAGANPDFAAASKDFSKDVAQGIVETVAATENINQNSAEEKAVEKEENVSEETVIQTESVPSEELVVEEVEENNHGSRESTEEATEWSFAENIPPASEDQVDEEEIEENKSGGFFAGMMSLFGSRSEESMNEEPVEDELTSSHISTLEENDVVGDDLRPNDGEPFCDATSCPKSAEYKKPLETTAMDFINFNSDIFLYLVTTAISVIIFLFGYIAFDKSKKEGPLVAKINKLEKELLIIVKENQILQEKLSTDSGYENNDRISNEVIEKLKQDLVDSTTIRMTLEEQVQSLEKELENSTEVGMELNRMLSEILRSESGSDVLKANVEHLQRQLVEQQATINSVNETLAITNTENHELRLELELSNKKVLDLQTELDKLLLNILKIEEEKEAQQSTLESEITNLRRRYGEVNANLKQLEENHLIELQQLQSRLEQAERKFALKSKEYDVLADTLKQLKAVKNSESTLQNLLEVSGTKAEYQLLKTENQQLIEKLQQEQKLKLSFEKRAQTGLEEIQQLKQKYDEADKLRVESQTKLEVLSNYFKDREAQWQKEISKHEALWAEKEGEATSTTERIKFMQEQLQNYKSQTESLKQEIMSQEIELKSQISVLEKKAHENWVSARQAERKLDEAKQEAAQLRHRLTLRERAIQEDKSQHRIQSPIEQNGDMPGPLESPASPPLLYSTRDHITKSPALPGLPPFLPPPPGVPFMPPPIHGVPPFIPPPPPNMFPGDHRPPPLGRMSSPPLNSRYSPNSRGYSPYDRNSSSPSDSEYGTSPPHRRAYSPFNNRSDDRRDYKRPPPVRNNGRNLMKGGGSSGSGHSNESLEKISRQQSKV